MTVIGTILKWVGKAAGALGLKAVGRGLVKLLVKLATNLAIKLAVAGSDGLFSWLENILFQWGVELSKKGTSLTTKLGKPELWNDSIEPRFVDALEGGVRGLESV